MRDSIGTIDSQIVHILAGNLLKLKKQSVDIRIDENGKIVTTIKDLSAIDEVDSN